jgi:hypothetical protein
MAFIAYVHVEIKLPLFSEVQGISTIISLLHQVLEIYFDLSLVFTSSKLTVDKSKETFHEGIDLPPRSPLQGVLSACSHFQYFP